MLLPEELGRFVDLARQPVAFKKHYYKYVLDPNRSFFWTEKTDGLRSVLVIWKGSLFGRRKKEYLLLDDAFPSGDTVVLDAELYEDRYYVFDCYYLDRDISGMSFAERYGLLTDWLDGVEYPGFRRKEFHAIQDENDLREASGLLSMERSPVSGNRIDGIILQDNESAERITQYKWKRARLITTDFYVRYDAAQNAYVLYVMGDPAHCKPMKRVSLDHTITVDGVILRPISVPIREGLHLFRPRADWDRDGYHQSEAAAIDDLMSVACSRPEALEGTILELSPARDGWVPLRIREDKSLPNSFKTAYDNILTYYEYPLFFEQAAGYYEDAGASEAARLTHDIAHSMRDSQFEHLSGFLPARARSVLDIGSGRGGDFERLVDIGLDNIFGIDDIYNCAKYAIRANRDDRACLLNLIPGLVGAENTAILEDIRSRAELPPDGFSVFVMDYAIHYLLEIPDGLRSLRELIRTLAAPEAVFLFTAFDGDQMLSDVRDGALRLGSVSISVDPEKAAAEMVLPTIKTEAVTERLFTGKDLEELGFKVLESFFPLREKERGFSRQDRDDGLFGYYRYMRAFIVSVWGAEP